MILATLIGIFITSNGIVVGSDTAISDRSGVVTERAKFCQTGPESVAAIQGEYYFEHAPAGASVSFYDEFIDLCSELAARATALALTAQADAFAERFRLALQAYVAKVDPIDRSVFPGKPRPLVRVAIAGFEAGRPALVGRMVGLASHWVSIWRVDVTRLTSLALTTCGTRFIGEDAVVHALRGGSNRRIPSTAYPESALAALRVRDGSCSTLAAADAREAFVAAVSITAEFGQAFGIRSGAVGGAIDLITIPRTGPVLHERRPLVR